jgi:hypothetical protein
MTLHKQDFRISVEKTGEYEMTTDSSETTACYFVICTITK